MNEYSQMFSVIGSKGKFRYARNGYIPALELPEPETLTVIDYKPRTRNDERRLEGLVLDLQNRMNKHIDASRHGDRL